MPADGSCPSPVTSMPSAKPVTATPTAQPSAEPSQSPTTEGERAPSEMPSNPPIKIVDEQEEACPPAGTEVSTPLAGASPSNDYNGYLPKNGKCQSNLGDRCRGFSQPGTCNSNFLENEFYNPGDWYMVEKDDYLYCQMPNQDIVCFTVTDVNHKEGDELIEYHLDIGCNLPNKLVADGCDPVDGYYFTDFVMKERNTVYYHWTDDGTANGAPAYGNSGEFITHNGGQRGLSHSSACLAKAC